MNNVCSCLPRVFRLDQACEHRRQAFAFLSQALRCEEQDSEQDPGLTVTLYRLGLRELDLGLRLAWEVRSVAAEGSEAFAEAGRARREMEDARRNAVERIRE